MKSDSEIFVLMAQMKESGATDDEVGYMVTKELYGQEGTTLEEVAMLRETVDTELAATPNDGFVLGTLRWLREWDEAHGSPTA